MYVYVYVYVYIYIDQYIYVNIYIYRSMYIYIYYNYIDVNILIVPAGLLLISSIKHYPIPLHCLVNGYPKMVMG